MMKDKNVYFCFIRFFIDANKTVNFVWQVTSLVHMPSGKVYDPLIGQWMSPIWEGILDRVSNPVQLHLYRFNGNDPINVQRNPQHLTGMPTDTFVS